MSDDFTRTPPHDLAAEQCVLGGMMLDVRAIEDVAKILKPADHYRPAHQLVHEAILGLYGRGEPADAVSVGAELTRRGDLSRVGGAPYLHTLIASVPIALNAGYYAGIVRETAMLRGVIEAGTFALQLGYQPDAEATAAFDRARARLDDVASSFAAANVTATDIGSLTYEALADLTGDKTELPGVPTGLLDLDNLVMNLRAAQFIVIAARPATGKSVLALNIAAHVALRLGKRAHFHSLEMSRKELTLRLLSAEAQVPLKNLIGRDLSDLDWRRLERKQGEIVDAPLFIHDRYPATLLDVRAEISAAVRAGQPPALVVVDYLQLVAPGRRADNRQQEVSDTARGLKALAMEFMIPVIGVAQLNRSPEQRTDKRPMSSDLRESGEIENSADVIILLHREDMYERESARAGEIDLMVTKNRNGATSTVTAAFQSWQARIVDMAWSPSSHAERGAA